MGEQDIIANLQGPMGGTFALGILVGSLLMWYANLKVVNPYVLRAHTAEMAAMQAAMTEPNPRAIPDEKLDPGAPMIVKGVGAAVAG